MKLRVLAIVTMVVAGSAVVVAQHGPAPKAHAEKAPAPKTEAKAPEAQTTEIKAAGNKTVEIRRGASASPLQTAAAVEQILRKLREDFAKHPAPRSSTSRSVATRLRLTWRLSLTWPSAVTDPQAP